MRTRFLTKMLNSEAEDYLRRNDIIIVPVGTVEMHGGFPLDSETVISEAFALKMAEKAEGLALNGLPFFYAGATASGRGTVQVSIREGIDYLGAIARSLLRQGFKRQIYISFHGPAHMTCSPMVRDFFDETGVPVLYMDLTMQMFRNAKDLFTSVDSFHAITVGAYDLLGRLEDIPFTENYFHQKQQSVSEFQNLFELAYQSGSIGYYFGEQSDHMSTPPIPDDAVRMKLAEEGKNLIEAIVEKMNIPEVVSKMQDLESFQKKLEEQYPWIPSAYSHKAEQQH